MSEAAATVGSLATPAPAPAAPAVRRSTQEDPLAVRLALTALALGVVWILIVVPLVNVFYQALKGGFGLYWHNLVGDPDTLSAIRLTLFVAPLAVTANTIFGIAAAWAIAR